VRFTDLWQSIPGGGKNARHLPSPSRRKEVAELVEGTGEPRTEKKGKKKVCRPDLLTKGTSEKGEKTGVERTKVINTRG